MIDIYQKKILNELNRWERNMLRKPGIFSKLSKGVQDKINGIIPNKVHQIITGIIREMVKVVLLGSKYTTSKPLTRLDLRSREIKAMRKIQNYKNTAAAEGGLTGAAGFLVGLADFPLLLSIKIKMLYDLASVYGFDLNDYRERIFLLYIFELAFSNAAHRKTVFLKIKNWETHSQMLSPDINQYDWRKMQQEYRDYIDLAKMAQLVPVIGAPVGFVANFNLVKKLGKTAMNAYRLRIINTPERLLESGLQTFNLPQ